MSDSSQGKAWAGRFTEPTDALVEKFTISLPFDKRLYKQDIACSVAHARMLAATFLISPQESSLIEQELHKIGREIEDGSFPFEAGDEDIHMAIERVLTERAGDAGARLHTARSRNDQVATDLRLWVKDEIKAISEGTSALQEVIVGRSEEYLRKRTIIPGYTHLQRAQPVLLSHHLLAYFWMLERDKGRLADCLKRADASPLGSAALSGTSLPIDRSFTCEALGFAGITENSLDAVSDRDFVVELLSAVSLIMVHLSRMAEEVILWTSSEFGFATLPDAFATGSSMMPQKKNADVAELVRGKSGRVIGNLMAMLTTLKGLPLSYNRDLQEDKEGLFDSVDTVKIALSVWGGLLAGLSFNEEELKEASSDEALIATDAMEYLVGKGVPLRKAHHIVGKIVRHALDEGVALSRLPLADYRSFSDSFDEDVFDLFSAGASVDAKESAGGTGFGAVTEQLIEARRALSYG